MERYRFFTRAQEEGESSEKFVTYLKLLASTCNFDPRQDSRVRDRITCGIRDSTLREELLKTAYLDLDRCLRACRVTEMSKEQAKAIESANVINTIEQKRNKRDNGKSPWQKREENAFCQNKRRRDKY